MNDIIKRAKENHKRIIIEGAVLATGAANLSGAYPDFAAMIALGGGACLLRDAYNSFFMSSSEIKHNIENHLREKMKKGAKGNSDLTYKEQSALEECLDSPNPVMISIGKIYKGAGVDLRDSRKLRELEIAFREPTSNDFDGRNKESLISIYPGFRGCNRSTVMDEYEVRDRYASYNVPFLLNIILEKRLETQCDSLAKSRQQLMEASNLLPNMGKRYDLRKKISFADGPRLFDDEDKSVTVEDFAKNKCSKIYREYKGNLDVHKSDFIDLFIHKYLVSEDEHRISRELNIHQAAQEA